MTDRLQIAVLDDWLGVATRLADWSPVMRVADVQTFPHRVSAEDLGDRLRTFDVLVLTRERTAIPAEVIEQLPNLRLIVATGRLNDKIDYEAAAKRGVEVVHTPSQQGSAAELTWALILSLAYRIPAADAGVRAGRWQTTLATRVAGKRLGLIGLGTVGAVVARLAVAFEMQPVAWSQNLTPERAQASGAELTDLDTLLATSDFVSIHVRSSDRTHHLIGARELALMKETAFLINTARGAVLDEGALARALTANKLAGAAVDVFEEEPPRPDHPLLAAPNLVMTPHIGYATSEALAGYYADSVEIIARWATQRSATHQ